MASKPQVFVDGQAGTTGLRIHELLGGRDDLELLEIAPERRKDPAARAALLNRAAVSILCLPDDAAREALGLLQSPEARVIDASTAHRVADGWIYGLPELAPGQRAAIASAKRVSNPGCYPSSVLLLVRPLVDAGLLAADAPLVIHALSGYSGGGSSLIARWEDPANRLLALAYEAPYALERRHKHVPEMVRHGRLAHEPCFVPAVGPFRCGMRVQVPLHASMLGRGANAEVLFEALRARYAGERFVSVALTREALSERSLDPTACNDSNRVQLHVLPHPSGHVLLVAILDNLGKGAAGAAVQSLNLMLGLPEHHGL
ncbi:MAG: N-acetyl-gamma-glutamyl-phosphate reductase [Polyangiales bacterium]